MKTQNLNGTERGLRILQQLHGGRCCLAWHVTKIKGIGQVIWFMESWPCSSFCRYKMLVQETWPNYNGIDKDGVGAIIHETGFTSDVKYGRTKLFIRTPMTVFELEKLRAEIVPKLVLFLQKVRRNYQQKFHTVILLFCRVRGVPLSLSLSCVIRKKTARQKCSREILPPEFCAAFISRDFLLPYDYGLSSKDHS